MFVGLTEYTTTNEMIQAMLQSIGLRIQQLLEFMSNDTKFHVSEIYVDGGASEDSYLVRSTLGTILILPGSIHCGYHENQSDQAFIA